MASCCDDKACEIEALRTRQSATLKLVLAINAVMFVVEIAAGIISGSVSLLADSLECLVMPWFTASASTLLDAAQERKPRTGLPVSLFR